MAPKLFKAAEVCDLAQLQPYVLRSWEKEFPGIGIQKSADGPRLYRQSDVDQVLRIKQLVFGEGLTLAGARRRLDEAPAAAVSDSEVAEVLDALASDARTRIAHVREGLQSILAMLSNTPGTLVVVDDYHLEPPPLMATAKPRAIALRSKESLRRKESAAEAPVHAKSSSASKRSKRVSA